MSGGRTVFPVGRDVFLWLRLSQARRPDRATKWLQLMIRWQSFWFQRNLALQRRLPQPPPLRRDPVFILGLWRSGTTFLHDMLGGCPGMIYPATWQCMNASSFRLMRSRSAPGARIIRPMDGFAIDAFSPQEDEFALLALGTPSVYRAFFDPRRLPELARWLDPDEWSISHPKGWMNQWREFLAGVVGGRPGRLILKSPNHTFRIRALLDAFPDAAYVWVVRNPQEVFFSNRKMWEAMFDRYALWNWRLADLDTFLLQALDASARCLKHAIKTLPPERLVVIDFEQLTRATLPTMDAINMRLRLGDKERARVAIEAGAARKATYRADAYGGRHLPSTAAPLVDELQNIQRRALTSHGVCVDRAPTSTA